jgi:hypothetical protein
MTITKARGIMSRLFKGRRWFVKQEVCSEDVVSSWCIHLEGIGFSNVHSTFEGALESLNNKVKFEKEKKYVSR